jgi:hypothetical protein
MPNTDISDAFLSRYEGHDRAEDALVCCVIHAGRPVGTGQLVALEERTEQPIDREGFRHGMSSVLEAPVRLDGVTLGTLVCGRTEHDDDFETATT